MIYGLSHVAVPVADLGRARRFYGDVLGLTEVQRPALDNPGAWFDVGGVQLHLGVSDQATPRGMPTHVALRVAVGTVAAAAEKVRIAGGQVIRPPASRDQFGAEVWSAFCTDPDGNSIELTDA